ncbi:MAG: hypothetical protein ACE5F5_13630, partial [Acidimicrobiia bacterium]
MEKPYRTAENNVESSRARQQFASHTLEVLQARAVLEAAEIQRQAIEAQTKMSKWLVFGTWALVAA